MYELLQIRAQLEKMQYSDTGSLFELRVMLMNAGALLTARHIANQKHDKDVQTSNLLLHAFRNIRQYYHILETTREAHEQCFKNIKELTAWELVSVGKKLGKSPANVVHLPKEQPMAMAAAR